MKLYRGTFINKNVLKINRNVKLVDNIIKIYIDWDSKLVQNLEQKFEINPNKLLFNSPESCESKMIDNKYDIW